MKVNVFTNGILGANVRAFASNGEIYFVANDLAKSLEYTKVGKMYAKIPDEYKANVSSIDGYRLLLKNGALENRSILITEAGVYAAIFRSKKKEAVRFQKWVWEDVLPTLRKTGTYVHELATPEQIDFAAENSLIEALRNSEYIGRRFKTMSIGKEPLLLKQSVAYIIRNTRIKDREYVLKALIRAVGNIRDEYGKAENADAIFYTQYSEVINLLNVENKNRLSRVYGQKIRVARDSNYNIDWVEADRVPIPISKKYKSEFRPIREARFNYGNIYMSAGVFEAKNNEPFSYVDISYSIGNKFSKVGYIQSPDTEINIMGTIFKYDYDTNEIVVMQKSLTKTTKEA